MNNQTRILIIDDDESIGSTLSRIFRRFGYETRETTTGKQGLAVFSTESIDLVLLDLQLPDMDGIDIAREMVTANPAIPIIVISAHGNIPTAVEATKLGVYDFLEKPLNRERLLLTVRNAIARRELDQRLARYQADSLARYQMIGQSPQMQQIFTLIERVAPSDTSVLILGENGVGKELVAQAIHAKSLRAKNKLIKINCAAIPDNLLESELFGHTKGAFSGAYQAKTGRFELADRSTLFLDEIGDLSAVLQAKILRFLENGEIQRVGSIETKIVDVRILAATNQNLQEKIKRNEFRLDLFYRLNGITISVPPVRERSTDIPLLLEHFTRRYAEKYGVIQPHLSPAALNFLSGYAWPGNIRQIQNFINKLMLLRQTNVIDLAEIRELMDETVPVPMEGNADEIQPLQIVRAQFEQQYLRKALERTNWQVSKAAELLGIDRAYLYRKMKNLGISIEENPFED